MSNQSTPIGSNLWHYVVYFNRLSERLVGTPTHQFHGDGTMTLAAKLMAGKSLVTVTIVLALARDDNFLAVKEFYIEPQLPGLLDTGDLFSHYGKRVAHKEGDLYRQNDEVWILRRPADLQALLAAYDSLAREWGLMNLFGH